jgi:hydroxyethylthiazole kinase-like sugar kinase family protein
MRAYRAARKEKADKVAAQMGPEIQAPQPQQQTQAPSDEQKRAEEQRQSAAKEYALKERQCVEAIAGTAELVADTVHMIYLQDVDPRLGQDRARQIGELWGPLLAPHINEKTAQHLPLLLAAGGTAGALYGWAAEVRKQRAKGGLRVVAGAA